MRLFLQLTSNQTNVGALSFDRSFLLWNRSSPLYLFHSAPGVVSYLRQRAFCRAAVSTGRDNPENSAVEMEPWRGFVCADSFRRHACGSPPGSDLVCPPVAGRRAQYPADLAAASQPNPGLDAPDRPGAEPQRQ